MGREKNSEMTSLIADMLLLALVLTYCMATTDIPGIVHTVDRLWLITRYPKDHLVFLQRKRSTRTHTCML